MDLSDDVDEWSWMIMVSYLRDMILLCDTILCHEDVNMFGS